MLHLKRLLTASICLLSTLPLQAADQVPSLANLLQQSQQQSRQIQQHNREREAAFLQQKQQRAALLKQAQQQLADLKQQNSALKTTFEDNELALAQTQQRLTEQLGELDSLFANAKQAAADLKALRKHSLLSLQQDSSAAIQPFLGESTIFTTAQLNALLQVFQQEIAENGKISTFQQQKVAIDGSMVDSQITRFGNFMLMDTQHLLQYQPDSAQLRTIALDDYADLQQQWFQADTNQLVTVPFDPSQGQLLQLKTQQPTLLDRIQQGGWIGYIIIAIGALGVVFSLAKWLWLMRIHAQVKHQLKHYQKPNQRNPLGRVLQAYKSHQFADLDTVELQLNEAVLDELPRLEQGHSMVKLLSAATPLLGLLGTVTGMIVTFQSITQFGTSDPKLMAGGISQALMTTVLGIVAALPLIFLHNRLMETSRGILHILQQQSAGLLAKHFLRQTQTTDAAQ